MTVPTWMTELARVGIATTTLPQGGWGARLPDVAAHGMTSLLLQAWGDGIVELDEHEVQAVTELRAAAVITSFRLESELVRLAATLDAYGIVVIKGPALARQAYDDHSTRTFTDLDLVVPAGGLRGPVRALVGHGYSRTWPDPAPGYLQHTARAVALRHPSGLLVDLHRQVSPGVGPVATRQIADAAVRLDIGGIPVQVPRPDHHAVVTALHAVIGHGLRRPLILHDLWQLLQRGPTPSEMRSIARAWDVTDQVDEALRAIDDLVTGRPIAVLPAATPDVAGVPPQFRGLQGMARLSAVRGAFAPTPAFVRARYGSVVGGYGQRWRQATRAARGGRS